MASSVIFSEEDFMENAKPPKDKTTSVEASGRKYTTPAPRIEVKATAASQARAALHPSLKTLSGKKEASSDSTTSAPSLKPTLPESKASTIKKPTTNPNGIGWSEMMKSFKASGETHIKPDKVSAFNDSKMTELCGVLEGKNIVSLDFSGKKFTTGAGKILANFLKLQPTITQLILANTVISLSELSILSQGFDYLEELDLSIVHSRLNTLSTDGVSILGAFETISNAGGLTKINFGEVKETHLPELTGLLQKNTSLQDIKLSAAKMSNIAFKKLIEAVSNKKLNSLKLSVESISFKLASEKSDGVAIEELLMPLIASKITYLDLTGAKFLLIERH